MRFFFSSKFPSGALANLDPISHLSAHSPCIDFYFDHRILHMEERYVSEVCRVVFFCIHGSYVCSSSIRTLHHACRNSSPRTIMQL